MARTIQSPGVEIKERDLSFNTNVTTGTNVFIAGYAKQGPVENVVEIASFSDFERLYGTPTNAAERYFYHSARNVLNNSNAKLFASRLGYDYNTTLTATQYDVLLYPTVASQTLSATISVTGNNEALGSLSGSLALNTTINYKDVSNDTTLFFAAPTHGIINKNVFESLRDGSLAWSVSATGLVNELNLDNLSVTGLPATSVAKAGFAIVNISKSIINEKYHGFYVNVSDNTVQSPASYEEYNAINKVYVNDKYYANPTLISSFIYQSVDDTSYIGRSDSANFNTLSGNGREYDQLLEVGVTNGVLDFETTNAVSAANSTESISEVVSKLATFDIDTADFNDTVVVSVFGLASSAFGDQNVLNYSLLESFVGSLDGSRKISDVNGGLPKSFFIEDVVNPASNYIQIYVNKNLSGKANVALNNFTWRVSNALRKNFRTLSPRNILAAIDNDDIVLHANNHPVGDKNVFHEAGLSLNLGPLLANNLYNIGQAIPSNVNTGKYLGNIGQKVNRVLRRIENTEIFDIDVIADAGLSTIAAYKSMASATNDANEFFDDTTFTFANISDGGDGSSDLYNESATAVSVDVVDAWNGITEKFVNFVTNNRQDCIFISDPLRYIFVQGNTTAEDAIEDFFFNKHITKALNNTYTSFDSSYYAYYANWARIFDDVTEKAFWMPMSSLVAAAYARTDRDFYPWYAPAGLTRGKLNGVIKLAVNPNQKQRDQLYRINANPVMFDSNEGFVIMGQKTGQRKPTALQSINVRREFNWFKKNFKRVSRYFVMEQNTSITRNRFRAALDPFLALAKNNEGVYDYQIRCDESNNTPDTIDALEMKASVYVKPTRAAEYVLIDLVATKTGANFNEIS